jgi:hypothetical protein
MVQGTRREMTTDQKKKAICKIIEGTYIFDEIEGYKVTKVYKAEFNI